MEFFVNFARYMHILSFFECAKTHFDDHGKENVLGKHRNDGTEIMSDEYQCAST